MTETRQAKFTCYSSVHMGLANTVAPHSILQICFRTTSAVHKTPNCLYHNFLNIFSLSTSLTRNFQLTLVAREGLTGMEELITLDSDIQDIISVY